MAKLQSNSTTTVSIKPDVFFSRIKRKFLRHVWLARISLLFGIILGVVLLIGALGLIIFKSPLKVYGQTVYNFLAVPGDAVKSDNGRTNILIMGRSGPGHEGPDLTDTIMLVSIDRQDRTIDLISLPRDIWIPALRIKLNSAYYWGKEKKALGGGLFLAKSSVEEILGQPVHYGFVIDFSGFKKVIDILGGVDVNVERTFTDEKYPIAGRENDLCGGDKTYACRYEIVHFEKGITHMDGEMALKFVRSRNAEGDEGTDLARAQRQQKVVEAVRGRLLTAQVLFSPTKILGIINTLKASIDTDLTLPEGGILARYILRSSENFNASVIPENFLFNPIVSPKYDNQYVFIPAKGDWSEVSDWAKNLLK